MTGFAGSSYYSGTSEQYAAEKAKAVSGKRIVFQNDMVVHVWAQQCQQEGRSGNHNVYFDGPALYSYGDHYLTGFMLPNAKRLVGYDIERWGEIHGKGTIRALINADSYSITTTAHCSTACGAVGYNEYASIPQLTALRTPLLVMAAKAGNKYCAGYKPSDNPDAIAGWEYDRYQWARIKNDVDAWAFNHIDSHAYAVGVILQLFGMAKAFNRIKRSRATYERKIAREAAKAEKREVKRNVKTALAYTPESIMEVVRNRISGNFIGEPDGGLSARGGVLYIKSLDSNMLAALKFMNANGYAKRSCKHVRNLRRVLRRERQTIEARINARGANRYRKSLVCVMSHARDVLSGATEHYDWTVRPAGYIEGMNNQSHTDDMETESFERALLNGYAAAREYLKLYGADNALSRSLRAWTTYVYWQRAAIIAERRQRSKERREQKAMDRESAKKQALANWLKGMPVHPPYGVDDGHAGVLVRAVRVVRDDSGNIVAGTLETSYRAHVPLVEAISVYRKVSICRARNTSWHRSKGERMPVGHFRVDRINADGSFKAGCQLFNWATIHALAESLGIASAT